LNITQFERNGAPHDIQTVGSIWQSALGLAIGTGAQSQTTQAVPYPTKPLKIVVPTSPGSGSDTTARFFGEQLSIFVGTAARIDNKPGANGVIAAMAVKQAPADGYSLFLATNTHMAVNPSVVKDLPYDPVKDFKPVSGLARGMMIFIASPNSKMNNVSDLVNAAKNSKQKLNVGTYTAGFHLSAEWFSGLAGAPSINVPTRAHLKYLQPSWAINLIGA
jgi:tripartite-type tricarboxylate transporter receptor subunit TctC